MLLVRSSFPRVGETLSLAVHADVAAYIFNTRTGERLVERKHRDAD